MILRLIYLAAVEGLKNISMTENNPYQCCPGCTGGQALPASEGLESYDNILLLLLYALYPLYVIRHRDDGIFSVEGKCGDVAGLSKRRVGQKELFVRMVYR